MSTMVKKDRAQKKHHSGVFGIFVTPGARSTVEVNSGSTYTWHIRQIDDLRSGKFISRPIGVFDTPQNITFWQICRPHTSLQIVVLHDPWQKFQQRRHLRVRPNGPAQPAHSVSSGRFAAMSPRQAFRAPTVNVITVPSVEFCPGKNTSAQHFGLSSGQ
jgi:hypothetical protein